MGGIWGDGESTFPPLPHCKESLEASQTWCQGQGAPSAPGPLSRDGMEEERVEAETQAVVAGQALRRPSSPNPS